MLKRIVFALLFLFGTQLPSLALALEFGDVKATIDRNNRKVFVLSIELQSVTTEDRTSLGITADSESVIQQAIVNNLDICVKGEPNNADISSCSQASFKIPWALARTPTPQDPNKTSTTEKAEFLRTVSTQDPQDITLYTYNIDVQITNSADYEFDTEVYLNLFPARESNNGNKTKTVKMTVSSAVNEKVEIASLKPSKQIINIIIKAKSSVTFADGTTGSPSGVGVLLVPVSETPSAPLPTFVYSTDPDVTPSSANCTVQASNLGAENETCDVTCPDLASGEQYFIDFDSALTDGMQAKVETDLAETVISFNGIKNTDPYAAIVQFLPEGLDRTCVIARASDAVTLTQLVTGKEPHQGDPTCFIATAAYGSPLDAHIDALRWFRQHYLLTNRLGKIFIHAYNENSPPVAQWIAERPVARTLVRGILWLPVLLIENLRDNALALFLFMSLALIPLFISRRRSV